ncbi:MAG: hypothetical protein A2Z16_15065 [Chloroflexi bacterium RBG_16_54_18]|nr:MAG: hypothetical protein A2Z16_15065 [Chloroflexi bacterium RBG_16_54_18]
MSEGRSTSIGGVINRLERIPQVFAIELNNLSSLDRPRSLNRSSQYQGFLLLLEWVMIVGGLLILTVTEEFNPTIPFSALLLVSAFTLRGVRTGAFITRTGLEVAWGIFLFSALVSTAVAYNSGTALLQFYRILAACVIYYSMVSCSDKQLLWLAAGFLGAAACLAIYWPLQHDFSVLPGKLPVITNGGLWINAHLHKIPGPSIHNNVAAGTLALSIPFGLACIWVSLRQRRRGLLFFSTACTLVVCAGLFLTSSRGAWLAVGGTASLAALVWLQQRLSLPAGKRFLYWLLAFLLGAAMLGSLLVSASPDQVLGQVPGADGAFQSRIRLWSQGLSIARDYPFTGSGLMTYWMVHSVYAMPINVPYIAHSHNTFLQVWIEQGLLGVIALMLAALAVLGWSWKAVTRGFAPAWGWTGLAALTIAFLHGLVDVVFYVERTLPLVGLPLGFAYLLNRVPGAQPQNPAIGMTSQQKRFLGILLLVTCLSALIANHRQLLSLWYSNIGAVMQSRVELASFDPAQPEQSGLDGIRQTADLLGAESAFEKALQWNSTNRTSLQRLAQIYLSRGKYTEALSSMRTAWEAGYQDEITRFLYSDALVAGGQLEEAASILGGLSWAGYRLHYQAWYRYWLTQDYARAANAWRTVLILEPENRDAANWLHKAEEELK